MALLAFSCAVNRELVVIHSNDTHSQVEVNDADDVNYHLGGYARRAAFIDSIRQQHKAVLLVDAGDFVQGTVYFNFFRGKVEAEAIRTMRYDAVTLGNHEFDNGVQNLADSTLSYIKTPVVSSNYDVSSTPLAPYVKPYLIVKKRGIKIGIVAAGVNPKNLINKFDGIKYSNPTDSVNHYARLLKENKGCDLVICLSHLGTKDVFGMSDSVLVANSENIDLVVGGHSHERIDSLKIKNRNGREIPIVQAGYTGACVGSVHFKLGKK